jgi:hypothetical protein
VKNALRVYEWLGPLLLTPLAAFLWWQVSGGDAGFVVLALAVPIVHAYVVPAIGTNVLKVWAFDSRMRIGGFRLQHGFLFGSATASITALLFLLAESAGALAMALATGAILLAINWAYDTLAIRHGILAVYNQPWADGAPPVAIAADYVFWFFGVFGLIYGSGMRLALDAPTSLPAWLAGMLAATLCVPTLLYIAASRLRHGHNGCRPVTRRAA